MQFNPAFCYKTANVTNTQRVERGLILFYEAKARFWRFYASHLYDMLLLRCVIFEISKLEAIHLSFKFLMLVFVMISDIV
ncbi:hypothetical protein T4D_792 [Trichinella pseudospiralis]|uniref:Uncharacterized protein n=1 Tax=Trichinella pseudospiralis TaxID=6337 RepID=A0A0V1F5U1_TRIPS|nr:hypothetical protein T4D_1006 [Trichinella pseudospiralis]KRY81138.1 hypothetical protein T4D_792 [Trichinella pseudospiralis]